MTVLFVNSLHWTSRLFCLLRTRIPRVAERQQVATLGRQQQQKKTFSNFMFLVHFIVSS
jgi:hypothetical protein